MHKDRNIKTKIFEIGAVWRENFEDKFGEKELLEVEQPEEAQKEKEDLKEIAMDEIEEDLRNIRC